MRILASAVAAVSFLALSPGAVAAQADRDAAIEIKATTLAPGIHQFTVVNDGYVEQLNSVAIETDRDILVFDTTTRPSTARTIIARLRAMTRKPVRYVVNSHWHPDHWSGNEVFADSFPGAEIIATELQRDFMQNTAAYWGSYLPRALADQEKAIGATLTAGKDEGGALLTAEKRAELERELVILRGLVAEQLKVRRTYPTLTYTDRMSLHHGGREFQFISVTGDAAGTTVLYLPKEKILITGDTVSYPVPYFTPPLSEHAKSIRRLAELDADIIVPGHGPAFRDKTYMLLEAELFEDVIRQTRAALRGGAVSIDDVQARVKLDAFRERFAKGNSAIAAQFDAYGKSMVRKAYIELRDSKEIR